MKRRRGITPIPIAALGMALCAGALATPAIDQQFESVCKPKAGTSLANAQCNTCHASPPKLNSFGQDLKAEMERQHSQKFTAAIWQKVSVLDSDKDGASNEAEVAASTLPGDPNSKPPS